MSCVNGARRRFTYRAEQGLFAAALLFLSIWAAAFIDSFAYQVFEGRRLDRQIAARGGDVSRDARGRDRGARAGGGAARASDGAERADVGDDAERAVGRIEIPRLGVFAMIASGVDDRTLSRAVGHMPGTARPGEPGNVGLAGHRDSFFRGLKDARAEDDVRIVTPNGTYDYRIESVEVVGPQRVDLLEPSASPTLTLVTCYPFHMVGKAPERFVVRARQVD